MKGKSPISVIMADDDFYAWWWNTTLLVRDPRTKVNMKVQTLAKLVKYDFKDENGRHVFPDVIVLDVEYKRPKLRLEALISRIKQRSPHTIILCLSQYGNPERNLFGSGLSGIVSTLN